MILTEAQRLYAVNWIERFVGQTLKADLIPEDLLELVFRELTRYEEWESNTRDQWGNWEWPYSQSARDGYLYIPRVDIAVQDWAKKFCANKNVSRWPNNKPFAICLTHDVDLISRRATSKSFIAELVRRCWRAENGKLKILTSQLSRNIAKYFAGPIIRFHKKDEYHCFDYCMELERRFGFKSTFFFFAERLPVPHVWDCGYNYSDQLEFYGKKVSVSEMMREMLRRGWDIGLHGSYLSAENLSALINEKKQLEKCIEIPISAIRHHYLHCDVRITPFLHQQAGLKADLTVGFNRNIGFRSGTAYPYYCWDHKQGQPINVLQIPMHIMDGPLFGSYGLECDINMAIKYAFTLMDRVAEVNGCLTLNWHPSWLSQEPYAKAYQAILKEASKRDAWGCTVKSLMNVVV